MARKKDVPLYLQNIAVTADDNARLSAYLSNWLRTHRYLMNLAPDAHEEVGKLLVLELLGKKRLAMVDRLSSKYNRMRALAFHNQISEYMDSHA